VGDAIVKGGRYDNLLKHFGKDAAAIGFVVVIDDLMTALSSQKIKVSVAESNALIVYEKENFSQALEKAIELRESGLYVELIPKDKSQEKYMAFARQNRYSKIFFV